MRERTPTETWRPVTGYEEAYEVSDLGQVYSQPRRNTKGGLLRQPINGAGYPHVTLCQGGLKITWTVHRLVADAFLGARHDGSEVRHLDGDASRPHASNLAYGTRSENALDAVRHGTHSMTSRTHCPQRHEYTPENTYSPPCKPNNRTCRTCRDVKNRDIRATRKASHE